MMPLENEGHSDQEQGQGNDDESESSIPKVAIRDDDLIVQILARLDGKSYNEALYQDARSINQNFLFPPHFPWHSRTRLPQKIMKSLPRDIDHLHVITHCQDELHAPFGDFQGPFGFGRYENGHARGNYSGAPLVKVKTGSGVIAAARRSHDPGVLELNVQIPLAPSINAINAKDPDTPTNPSENRGDELEDIAQSEMLSHLPFCWSKKVKCRKSVGQHINHTTSANEESRVELTEIDIESHKLTETRSQPRAQLERRRGTIRKWFISMKIGGVSSRTTLFPSSTRVVNTDGDRGPENTRNIIQPMLCLASLPQSIQSGQMVSMENALEMDNKGFAHSLGSYDRRYTDSLLNQQRDSFNRAKRIEIGRTRLLWSNLIQRDESSLSSSRNKLTFNSLISGQRIHSSQLLLPTEIKVGVRLNGRLLVEEVLEESPMTTTSSIRKRKRSTRQAENEGPALKAHIQIPASRTDEEIDAALQNISTLQARPSNGQRRIQQGWKNGAVVYLEMGSQPLSHSYIDRNDIIASLLKFNQKKSSQKKLKRSASSEAVSMETAPTLYGGMQYIKKIISPRISCVPLEDGLLRTVCLNAGSMPGTSVHQVIREFSEQEFRRRCSVCWSDEGTGKEGVLECVKCGVLAHSNCCLGKGEFITSSKTNEIERSANETEQWQCTVCCHHTEMKPRRNSRMPSRFVDGETYELSNHTGGDSAARNANVPGPQCFLCPHRGGAMSPLGSKDDPDRKWAHEVCRVWSGRDPSGNPKTNECLSLFPQFPTGFPLSNVCALCGTGGTKGNKPMQSNTGLTRCAARGCYVTFHPMCAQLARIASKVGGDEECGKVKSARTRKTRHTEQATEENKLEFNANVDADKKLCKEYTLQLVELKRTESTDETTVIPVAFCGIHNPRREDSFFGCPPVGAA